MEKKDFLTATILCFILVIVIGGLLSYSVFDAVCITSTKIIIEHKWVENEDYYFSDSNDFVYLLKEKSYVEVGQFKRAIKYNELPKSRFESLEEGKLYQIDYCFSEFSITGMRLSINEKKVLQN